MKKRQKILFLLVCLVVCVMFTSIAGDYKTYADNSVTKSVVSDSGVVGADTGVQWQYYDATKELKIVKAAEPGEITTAFTESNRPWQNYISSVEKVTIDSDIKVTNMSYWFKDFVKLKSIDFAIPATATTIDYMFSGCTSLKIPEGFTIPEGVTNAKYLFANCSSITTIPSSFTTPTTAKSLEYMFTNTSIKKIPDTFILKAPQKNMLELVGMFAGSALEEVSDSFTIPGNIRNSSAIAYMFKDCTKLKSIPKCFSTEIIGGNGLFQNCKSLKEIPADFVLPKVFTNIFLGCEGINLLPKELKFSSSVIDIYNVLVAMNQEATFFSNTVGQMFNGMADPLYVESGIEAPVLDVLDALDYTHVNYKMAYHADVSFDNDVSSYLIADGQKIIAKDQTGNELWNQVITADSSITLEDVLSNVPKKWKIATVNQNDNYGDVTIVIGMECSVKFETSTGGKIANANPQTVFQGNRATVGVTYAPINSEYSFVGWEYEMADGTDVSRGVVQDYTDLIIVGDVTFTARFAHIPFLNISSTGNGFVAAGKMDSDIKVSDKVIDNYEMSVGETTGKVAFKPKAGYELNRIIIRDIYGHELEWDMHSANIVFHAGNNAGTTISLSLLDNNIIEIKGMDTSVMLECVFTKVDTPEVPDINPDVPDTNPDVIDTNTHPGALVPSTGDLSNASNWIVLMVISVAFITFGYAKKRMNTKN